MTFAPQFSRRLLAGSTALLAAFMAPAAMAQAPAAKAAAPAAADLVTRGAYVARAADCEVCHTASDGQPNAGGLPFKTPFGTIWSSNITPDVQTGIGGWSEAQFEQAVRHGIRADGAHLYPAMPYTSYVKLSDGDVHALWAYLRARPAVHHAVPTGGMGFPYNQRWALGGWKAINFADTPFTPDAGRDAVWNRGKYLATALGHCEECHTPRNLTMGLSSHAYAGATVDGWQAFNISSDPVAGIGGWSEQELERYLSTGALPGKATAAGGMADVIGHSLRYLTPGDLTALATYIKGVAPQSGAAPSRFAAGAPHDVAAQVRGLAQGQEPSGAQLFAGNCASCHGRTAAGIGTDRYYPSLFHNSAVGAAQPNNLVQVILNGVHRTNGAGQDILMPAFADQLTDAQIARLAGYVIDTYGQGHGAVDAAFVARLRANDPFVLPGWALLGGPLVVAGLGVALVLRRRRRLRRA
jgi:fructose 5-dehydrogenase cytochrome subunit